MTPSFTVFTFRKEVKVQKVAIKSQGCVSVNSVETRKCTIADYVESSLNSTYHQNKLLVRFIVGQQKEKAVQKGQQWYNQLFFYLLLPFSIQYSYRSWGCALLLAVFASSSKSYSRVSNNHTCLSTNFPLSKGLIPVTF